MVSGIKGFLTGEKARPSEQRSGLRELIEIFPELRGVGEDIIGRGTELAGQEAPFTPAQIAQLSGLEQQGLAGLGALRAQPEFKPQFGFGQRASERFGEAGDVFGEARGLFGRVAPTLDVAGQRITQGASPITGQQIETGIGQFLNPFTQQVIDPAAREAREAGLGLLSDIAGQATGAGAFGGQRQALLETQVPELVAQQVGDISGRLRSQGFESAAGRALQNLMGERQRSLTGAGLGIQQAGQFGAAGQGLTGLGGQLGQLGSRLFQARQGVQDIQSQRLTDAMRLGQAQLGAGQLPRQLEQAGLQREAQIGQIPLQQLQLLQGIIGGFPASGVGVGAQAATSGLLGSGGSSTDALKNIISLIA